MARPASDKPTQGEILILRLLWKGGALTVREVCSGLGESANGAGPAYSSVQTRLLLMVNKGLVKRDESIRPAKFSALITEASAKKHVFRELLDRFFRGSTADLVMHALGSQQLSAAERAAIGKKLKDVKGK